MIQKVPEVFLIKNGSAELQVFMLNKGEGVPWHKHATYTHELCLVRGKAVLQIGPILKELDAPSQVIFPEGTDHNFEAAEDSTVIISVHPVDGKWQQ